MPKKKSYALLQRAITAHLSMIDGADVRFMAKRIESDTRAFIATASDPDDLANCYLTLGILSAIRADREATLEHLARAKAAGPMQPNVWRNEPKATFFLGLLNLTAKSITEYEELAEGSPDRTNTLASLAWNSGMYETFLRLCRKFKQMDAELEDEEPGENAIEDAESICKLLEKCGRSESDLVERGQVAADVAFDVAGGPFLGVRLFGMYPMSGYTAEFVIDTDENTAVDAGIAMAEKLAERFGVDDLSEIMTYGVTTLDRETEELPNASNA